MGRNEAWTAEEENPVFHPGTSECRACVSPLLALARLLVPTTGRKSRGVDVDVEINLNAIIMRSL